MIDFFRKPLWLDESEYKYTKRECYFSLVSICINLLLFFLLLIFFKTTSIYIRYIDGNMTYIDRMIFGGTPFVITLILLSGYMFFTKQGVSSIGIRRKGFKKSVLILIPIFLFALRNIPIVEPQELISKAVFYFIFIGFYEEVIFRGFLWPRMNVIMGKWMSLFVTGMIFGAYHIPISLVWRGTGVFGSDVSILGGVVGQLIFGYIYTRTDNIVFPSAIHGLLDFLGGLN